MLYYGEIYWSNRNINISSCIVFGIFRLFQIARAVSRNHLLLRHFLCLSILISFLSAYSEVAVLQSSEQKLYMLLISSGYDGSGQVCCGMNVLQEPHIFTRLCCLFGDSHLLMFRLCCWRFADITLSQIGCHKMEDVKEAIVGLGLQVVRQIIVIISFSNQQAYNFYIAPSIPIFHTGCVRVYIGRNGTYRFVTRSLEKSRQLFCILDIFDSYVAKDGFSMRR